MDPPPVPLKLIFPGEINAANLATVVAGHLQILQWTRTHPFSRFPYWICRQNGVSPLAWGRGGAGMPISLMQHAVWTSATCCWSSQTGLEAFWSSHHAAVQVPVRLPLDPIWGI